jgi:hypothetical protein
MFQRFAASGSEAVARIRTTSAVRAPKPTSGQASRLTVARVFPSFVPLSETNDGNTRLRATSPKAISAGATTSV